MWATFSAPSLYGIFPYAGLKFYFYEEMKCHVSEEHKKSIMVKLVCGSVAGLLGQTFTYPLDVVRRQMQVNYLSYLWRDLSGTPVVMIQQSSWQVQRNLASDSAELKGTIETLVLIAQKQGWKQLFSGLSINYLKVWNLSLMFSLSYLLPVVIRSLSTSGCTLCCNWVYCLWPYESIPKSSITWWSCYWSGSQ